MNVIQNLLTNVKLISKKYQDIALVTGENFNIFSILSVERNEVKTHSAFIGELLNPKGSHGLDEIPLNIFLTQIKTIADEKCKSDYKAEILDRFNLDLKSAYGIIEEHIGITNEDKTEGGRIDIIIKDGSKKTLIIENKIDAMEQTNQLIRYNNAYLNAPILFLTLTGYEANSAGHLKLNEDYFTISYEVEIITWLKECLKEATEFPMLREIIKQYIYLIKKMTNQTTNNKMKEEIRELINISNVDNIELLYGEVRAIVIETSQRFFDYVNSHISEKQIQIDEFASVIIGLDQDSNGIFIYYQLLKSGINDGKSAKAFEFASVIKNIKRNAKTNTWNFAWYTPVGFSNGQKFESLSKSEILKMYKDEEYLKKIAQNIIDEENEIRIQFINKIQQSAST